MKFRITWPSGLVTEEISETKTVDGYAMERWGFNTAAQVMKDFGVKIEEFSAGLKTERPSDPHMSPEAAAAAAAKAASIAASKAEAAARKN